METRTNRFTLFAALTFVPLGALTIGLDAAWSLTHRFTFLYFLGAGIGAKVLGDAWYYALSPGRRHWLYLEQYLWGDLLVHMRFVFPLACVQALVANQALLYVPVFWPVLRPLWVSPIGGTVVWVLNRYRVELAEERRYRPVGTRAADLTRERRPGGS